MYIDHFTSCLSVCLKSVQPLPKVNIHQRLPLLPVSSHEVKYSFSIVICQHWDTVQKHPTVGMSAPHTVCQWLAAWVRLVNSYWQDIPLHWSMPDSNLKITAVHANSSVRLNVLNMPHSCKDTFSHAFGSFHWLCTWSGLPKMLFGFYLNIPSGSLCTKCLLSLCCLGLFWPLKL